MTGKRIDSGFHVAFSFITGLTTGQGASVEVALTAEDTIQTLQLVKLGSTMWQKSVWNTTCLPF